jgi:hypothetical protein
MQNSLVSKLVFSTSIIERVKCNWLSHENRHDIEEGLTDNELVLDFVKLSNRHNAEAGLADEIATIVMSQMAVA